MKKTVRILNLIFFVAMVLLNYYAGYFSINGNDVASVSDGIDSLFTPAGYVFLIWGIIYLGLGAFVVYGVSKKQKDNVLIDKIGPWFIINAVVNMAWLVAWLYEIFWLSQVFMVLLLITLIVIYQRLGTGKFKVQNRKNFWFILAPFSLYFGWVSVATVANTSVLLVVNGITEMGISGEFWTIFMLLVAYLLGTLMVILRHDWIYAFVVIWAAIGIGIENSNSVVLGIAAIIVALGLTLVLYLDRKEKPFAIRLTKKG